MKSPLSTQVVCIVTTTQANAQTNTLPHGISLHSQSELPDFWATFRKVAQDLTHASPAPSIVNDIKAGRVTLTTPTISESNSAQAQQTIQMNKQPEISLE